MDIEGLFTIDSSAETGTHIHIEAVKIGEVTVANSFCSEHTANEADFFMRPDGVLFTPEECSPIYVFE